MMACVQPIARGAAALLSVLVLFSAGVVGQQAEWETSNAALAAKLDGLNSHLEPKIAMQCDFVNMHLDTTSGEWIPDKNNKSDCLTEKMDILEYCRKVYPNIDITNVVEAADSVKISNWCKGEHKLCKWHHVVKPYRCLVGPFQSDPLLVPEHCLFDHVHNAARCWTFDRWNATADESCSNRAMRLSSFAMLLPCGIDMFSGVEFVCCPGNDDAAVPTSASPGVRDTDRYFFHVSQEEEHEEFRAALQRVEEKHRSKVTKVMKEWAELEDRYQDMKKNDPNAAETFKKEMTTRFQKTVEALEDEGQAEKRQVVAVHQQRVEARINDNKRVAMETYRQALVQIPPQAHKILKALQKYMRAEEKDRTHSVNHFKHLKRTDPETAQQLQSSVQAHLVKIEERINQSVAMLQKLPEIARKIAPQVESLVEDFKYTEVDVKFADGSVWVPADVSLVEKYRNEVAEIEAEKRKEVVEEDIASDDSSESDDDDTTIQTTTADDSNDAIDSEDHVKKDADDADADADDDDDDDDNDDDDDDGGGGGANSDFATDKPMRRGKIFYDSGNVTEIQDVRKGSQYFVKAKVLASMRKTTYSVLFSLSVNSGFVSDATCDCRASALGRCSHVAAVLYALSYCVENSSDRSVPCTSKPCTWNRGRKQGKNPKKITETSYPKTHSSSVIQFDPRPLSQQSTAQMPQEEINNFSISLQSCSKNLSMWETLLPVIYDDYVLSEEEKVVLLVKVDQLIENLTPEEQGPVHVVTEQGTDQWHALRALRVTASNAKAIARAHDSTRPTLVQKQLWGSSATTLAMLYGIEHEQDARVDFAQQFTELTVTECGLWLNGKYPGLGASPDGVVYDSSSNSGVLEIKCPISIKTVAPQDFAEVLNYKQQKSFCLASVACENNKYYLKKSHVYYTQIQIQMLILEKEWGYFLIWTPHGLFAEKIPFDSEHVDEIVPRLSDFHKKCLCPEYFEMRLPRRLSLIQLS